MCIRNSLKPIANLYIYYNLISKHNQNQENVIVITNDLFKFLKEHYLKK